MHISQVATAYVSLLFEYLETQGIAASSLLGPRPDERESPHVPVETWHAMLQAAHRQLGGSAFGLRVARCATARHFGIVGYLVLASANLGEALMRAERYAPLVYDLSPLRLALDDDHLVMRWGTEYGRPGQLVDETGVGALIQLARDITGSTLTLLQVAFVNPAPPDLAPYEDFFQCPVKFDAPATELHFPASALNLSLRQADAGLLALLDSQAEAMLSRNATLQTCTPYQGALVRLLRNGEASLCSLARSLNISPRTLQRRFALEGTSYQEVLDNTRHTLACEYLRDVRLSLTDIGMLLGYSEQSAFTRAFRSWTGCSPSHWRRERSATGIPDKSIPTQVAKKPRWVGRGRI